MEWNDAIFLAKESLGVYGYTHNFDEVIIEARNILSYNARKNHEAYLQSEEWKIKRENILKRDKYICQDCLRLTPKIKLLFKKIYPINKINYKPKATQVHHLDYYYKQTDLEEEYCISLCRICHLIRHATTTFSIKTLHKGREENILMGIYYWLLKQPYFIKIARKQHDNFIKSLTIKPSDWLIKEVKDGVKRNNR